MKKTRIELVDDRDGVSAATETVTFGLDTVEYDMDLTSANAAELRELMDTWALYARRIPLHRPSSIPSPRRRSTRIYPIVPAQRRARQ